MHGQIRSQEKAWLFTKCSETEKPRTRGSWRIAPTRSPIVQTKLSTIAQTKLCFQQTKTIAAWEDLWKIDFTFTPFSPDHLHLDFRCFFFSLDFPLPFLFGCWDTSKQPSLSQRWSHLFSPCLPAIVTTCLIIPLSSNSFSSGCD